MSQDIFPVKEIIFLVTGNFFPVTRYKFPVTGNRYPVTKIILSFTGKMACDTWCSFSFLWQLINFFWQEINFLWEEISFLSQEEKRTPYVTGKIVHCAIDMRYASCDRLSLYSCHRNSYILDISCDKKILPVSRIIFPLTARTTDWRTVDIIKA